MHATVRSLYCEMSNALDASRLSADERIGSASPIRFRCWLQDHGIAVRRNASRCSPRGPRKGRLVPRCGVKISHFMSRALRQRRLSNSRSSKNPPRRESLSADIPLPDRAASDREGTNSCDQNSSFSNNKFAALHHTPAAQVDKVRSDERRSALISKKTSVSSPVLRLCVQFFDVFRVRNKSRLSGQPDLRTVLPAAAPIRSSRLLINRAGALRENNRHIARGVRKPIVRSQPANAGPQTPIDVGLQQAADDCASDHGEGLNEEPLVNKMQGRASPGWKEKTARKRVTSLS